MICDHEIRALSEERDIPRHLATRSAAAIMRMRKSVAFEQKVLQNMPIRWGAVVWRELYWTLFSGTVAVACGQAAVLLFQLFMELPLQRAGAAGFAAIGTVFATAGTGLCAWLSLLDMFGPLRRHLEIRRAQKKMQSIYDALEAQRLAYLERFTAEGHEERIAQLSDI